MASSQPPITLETAHRWARSGHESDKVYRFLFLHPDDFFTVPIDRRWPIAHQVVYNGDVYHLKRILALFSDDRIDIRTLSKDNKTLLDVATERRSVYQEMYNYIEGLFRRDDLIRAAKNSDWGSVSAMLKKHPELINEKPSYSTFFLLHYIVQNGDKKVLEDFCRDFRPDTNVFSTDLETPLDLARRLRKADMCSVLESATSERPDTDGITYKPSILPEGLKYKASLQPNREPTGSTSSKLPYPPKDPFPSVDLHNTSIVVTEKGNYAVEKTSLFSITQIGPASPVNIGPTNKIADQYLNPNPNPELAPPPTTPITPATKSQLLKNLTCPLTQRVMIDPVIATDGQTYEREAILEWISIYQCSPITGASMDATVKDNTELKQIIQTMTK